MQITIEYDSRVISNVTPDEAREMSIPQEAIDIALAKVAGDEQRAALRQAITKRAGDVPSILGTAADATQLLLYGMAQLVKGLSEANSLAEVREAAAPFAALSADFLAKVESGEVKLPFMAKGIENVVADIEGRSTAVADVFAAFTADREDAAQNETALKQQSDSATETEN